MAGSGASEQQDEEGNAPSDEAQPHSVDDGYQTGIPGPITRLFVIANRGVANLVQDLILVSDLYLETVTQSWKLFPFPP